MWHRLGDPRRSTVRLPPVDDTGCERRSLDLLNQRTGLPQQGPQLSALLQGLVRIPTMLERVLPRGAPDPGAPPCIRQRFFRSPPGTCRVYRTGSWPGSVGSTASARYYVDDGSSSFCRRRNRTGAASALPTISIAGCRASVRTGVSSADVLAWPRPGLGSRCRRLLAHPRSPTPSPSARRRYGSVGVGTAGRRRHCHRGRVGFARAVAIRRVRVIVRLAPWEFW